MTTHVKARLHEICVKTSPSFGKPFNKIWIYSVSSVLELLIISLIAASTTKQSRAVPGSQPHQVAACCTEACILFKPFWRLQMDPAASVCDPLDLERMLIDERAEPRYLRISLLESITNNFSNDLVIGSGGFSIVYKGRLQNGTVAVKKLKLTQTSVDVQETKFQQEVDSLMSVKHKYIVRFLGYCSDTQGKVWKLNGKNVMAEERQRFLCFEYLPWSLDKYIKDSSRGHEWRTSYQIIKGVCEGLHYLHQQNIVHLDLKPANILLDHYMLPKIADFGLSKCFDENQTRAMTSNPLGTLGYMAPESYGGLITFKSDIYSLGIIIIEILTGNTWCPVIDNVLESWSVKFKTSPGDTQLEPVRVCAEIGIECTDFNPTKRPDTRRILERLDEMESIYGVIEAELGSPSETNASSCVSDLVDEVLSMDVAAATRSELQQISSVPDQPVETSPEESSSISVAPSPLQRITGVLQGPGGTSRKILCDQSSEISKLLDIHPLELRFPWEPNRAIKCPLTLTNRTDRYVGVWITPTCEDTSSHICFYDSDIWEPTPNYLGKLEPHSTIVVSLEMKAEPESPPDAMFEVLMVVTRLKEECLEYSGITDGRKLNMESEFLKRVEKLDGEVHRATLKAVICDPASCQTVIHNQHFIPAPSSSGFGFIRDTDLQPTETWILVCQHSGSSVSIFNYETQKIEMAFEIKRVSKKKESIFSLSIWKHILSSTSTDSSDPFEISSAKFIAQEQWFVVGDDEGWVHVYSYTMKDKVMEFKAYKYGIGVVLAIHPTSPYLLTSSSIGEYSIKLWDWSKGWECTRKFDNNSPYVTWNPMDSKTFISIDIGEGDVMVWNIHSSDPVTKLEGSDKVVRCCFYSDGHHKFMFTRERLNWNNNGASNINKVWDMEMMKHVHELVLRGYRTSDIACHPTLPILVTVSRYTDAIFVSRNMCTVFVWDARTYRIVKMVYFDSWIGGMVLTGTKDSTRLILGFGKGMSVMEIDLPTLDMADLHTDGRN